jgi:hypothetical protein
MLDEWRSTDDCDRKCANRDDKEVCAMCEHFEGERYDLFLPKGTNTSYHKRQEEVLYD